MLTEGSTLGRKCFTQASGRARARPLDWVANRQVNLRIDGLLDENLSHEGAARVRTGGLDLGSNADVNPTDLWWQVFREGPLLLAWFDADGRLQQANTAYRQAWALGERDAPKRCDMAAAAHVAGVGPVDRAARRSSTDRRGYEQLWLDGRRLWWVEQPAPDGGCICVGVDISGLDRPRPPGGQLLDAQAGMTLLQSLLSDARAWPLCVATTLPGAEAQTLLASIRADDGCARLADGRLLLILPSTGPAQAAALCERLGGLEMTEAQWGESATELLLRA